VTLVIDDEDAIGHHPSSRPAGPLSGSRMIIVVPLPTWLSTSRLP